jgi:predicted RNA-binding Zn ribbon-like protein
MDQKEWDFDAGNLALDFANTAEFHASDHPDEMLESYADLVSWAAVAGLLSRSEAQALHAKAKKDPQAATKALDKALELRELIYRILSAIGGDESPDQADLSTFNRMLSESLINTQISPLEDGYTWSWQNMGDSLDSMIWPIARETADLLTSKEVRRLGECADDRGCGYLFIDTSRNHSRRWCSMEACGNRAKAQRHYEKMSEK